MNSIIAYSPALMKDGDILMITMPKVSEYHRSGKIWCSPPFHYKEGYKMCLVVRGVKMESASKSTHLTVSIKLLRGENDDKLRWPIGHKGRCTMPPLPPLSQCTTSQVSVQMCGLKPEVISTGSSSKLVNDCLTFNVWYGECFLDIKIN
jgi:hypothetical protein